MVAIIESDNFIFEKVEGGRSLYIAQGCNVELGYEGCVPRFVLQGGYFTTLYTSTNKLRPYVTSNRTAGMLCVVHGHVPMADSLRKKMHNEDQLQALDRPRYDLRPHLLLWIKSEARCSNPESQELDRNGISTGERWG